MNKLGIVFIALAIIFAALAIWYYVSPKLYLYYRSFGDVSTTIDLDRLIPIIQADVDKNFTQHSPLDFSRARETVTQFEPQGISCKIEAQTWVWNDSGMHSNWKIIDTRIDWLHKEVHNQPPTRKVTPL